MLEKFFELLKKGDLNESVRRMQIYLSRISGNYPAIPKIPVINGAFDENTENAVKAFQRISVFIKDIFTAYKGGKHTATANGNCANDIGFQYDGCDKSKHHDNHHRNYGVDSLSFFVFWCLKYFYFVVKVFH